VSNASNGSVPARRGRPRNLARDPLGVKPLLAQLNITLKDIATRALGSSSPTPAQLVYICNVLSGRQQSRPVVKAINALIAERLSHADDER
jgi:hypothetical protein